MASSEGLNVSHSILCLFESVVRMLHFHFHVNAVMHLTCQTITSNWSIVNPMWLQLQWRNNIPIWQFRFIVAVLEINIHPLTCALYLHNREQHVSEGDAGNSGVCGTWSDQLRTCVQCHWHVEHRCHLLHFVSIVLSDYNPLSVKNAKTASIQLFSNVSQLLLSKN